MGLGKAMKHIEGIVSLGVSTLFSVITIPTETIMASMISQNLAQKIVCVSAVAEGKGDFNFCEAQGKGRARIGKGWSLKGP